MRFFEQLLNGRLTLLIALGVLACGPALGATSGSKTVANGGGSVSYVNAADVRYVGNDLLIKFTADAAGSFTLPGWAQANILVVGGGGAGGSGADLVNDNSRAGGGGGGGGGGVVETNGCYMLKGTYSVTVGKGGAKPASVTTMTTGASGESSTITFNSTTFLEALGGGGGGAQSVGLGGANGGGGSMLDASGRGGKAQDGGEPTDSTRGFKGGNGNKLAVGGGGGGAGGEGVGASVVNTGGNGGAGQTSSITGNSVTYGGGGGGGKLASGTTASTAEGGGGKGGQYTTAAQDGTKETGGGGGGCGTGTAKIGGAGGSGVVYVRVTMAMAGPLTRPASPVTFMYDGMAKTSVVETVGYTVSGANFGTNAATYVAYATPREPFTWDDDSEEPAEVRMVIEQSTKTTITGLVQPGWRFGTPVEETPAPSCTASFGAPVTYDYGPSSVGPFDAAKPTAVGSWYVRASVEETANYVGTNVTAKFAIWDDPANTFLDYVDIEVSLKAGTTPAELANFPVKVTLAENSPVGFTYSRGGTIDGESLSFTTADGSPVPYIVESWNSSGESVLYVRVPRISTTPQKLRLYWKVKDGANVPDHYPDDVWTDWQGPDSAKYKPYADRVSETFGFVYTDGKTANYWAEYPEMSKTEWRADDTPGTLVKEGKLAYPGTTIVKTIIDSISGEILTEMPTTQSGVYRLSFVQDDPDGLYSLPEYHIDFRITTRLPQDDLVGDATNVTAAGRILLANDDKAEGHKITDQCYAQPHLAITRERVKMKWVTTTNTYDIFWSHEGTHDANKVNYPNIQAGSVHRLYYAPEKNGREVTNLVWRLENVLIGNTSPANNNIVANKCALPWSTTGGAFDSFTNNVASTYGLQKNAAHLMLRNQENAAIYSPCYTNGIGTIYFDAVNSWRDNLFWTTKGIYNDEGYGTPSYSLVLEMATNTVDNLPPTDAYADGPGIDDNWCELGRIFNDTAEQPGQWHPVPLLPLVRDNTPGFVATNKTEKLVLAVNKGGSADNFYRVCAQINYRGPIRFRIRRVDTDIGRNADGNAFILVDNVIVSYPEMTAELDSFGSYDGSRTGKQVLGQANATLTPFPSVTDKQVLARARPKYYVSGLTNADEQTFIQLARLHYRWRYLDQADEGWQTLDLNNRAGGLFTAETPLAYPPREGDLEYWFETFAQLPFYSYYDYSGKNLFLKDKDGGELYTEERATFTNRMALATGQQLPSGGTDWFMRLRRGKSDYAGFRVLLKLPEGEKTVEGELVGDHCWRAYFQVPGELKDGLPVRFEAYDRQTPGTATYETNTTKYRLRKAIDETPKTETLVEETDETWTSVVCDGLTGWLVFQIDDSTRSVTLAHADYQDFNKWSDANKLAGDKRVYVGTSTDTNSVKVSGSSSKTQEFTDGLGWWHLSKAENPAWWSESFTNDEAVAYEPFTATNSPNGFAVGPGMWVYSNCRDPQTGLALQMEGKGKGYVQFVNKDEAPRGLGAVRFKARLGQAIAFDDFSYCDSGDKTAMTSYTFLTRACFDLANRTEFSGNASLSVVGFFRADTGCYEFRVEQEGAKKDSQGKYVPSDKKRFALYRWNYDEVSEDIQPTLLGAYSYALDGQLKTSGEHGNMSEIFLSLHDTGSATVICAGVQRATATVTSETGSSAFSWFAYVDNDNTKDVNGNTKRHTCGSYGVLSANCPGRFIHPLYSTSAQKSVPSDVSSKVAAYPGFTYNVNRSYTFPAITMCFDDLSKGRWAVKPRRMQLCEEGSDKYYGLMAQVPKQVLNIYTAPAGKSDGWTLLESVDVSGFGDAGTATEVWLRTVDDCSVKLAPGGTDKSARNDVVIDDIEFIQWRGEHFDDREGLTYFPDTLNGSPSNVVFTQGWIRRDTSSGLTNCLLSARRSQPDVATSVRSPLMDGDTAAGRGSGLGMFRFTYANAQTNVNLLLQVCTNGVGTSNLSGWSKRADPDEEIWHTVTNYSFAGLSEQELAGGTHSYYFGWHGAKGVMRLVMDPKVVEAVAGSDNPDAFGEIEITGVLCRDEPNLDRFSWWGWNLRTSDEEELMNFSDHAANPRDYGLSFGLNNAVDRDIREVDAALYPEHEPFLQTPTFAADVVGEVSFKARKHYASDPAVRLTLFGARTGSTDDLDWTRLAGWDVTNETFTSYAYKTTPGNSFKAFRFVVTGVPGVRNPMPDPQRPKQPRRVVLDEVLVMETVFAKVGFRNVAAFRSMLDRKTETPNAQDRSEQPLVGDAWGVQAEIYKAQLPDEVDLAGAKVRLWWFEGTKPWGFEKWRDDPKAKSAWLTECEGTTNVYKSCYYGATDAVIPASKKATTMQYMLEVQYMSTSGVATNWLEQVDWDMPNWYHPVDYNASLGHNEPDQFAGFTILDTVSPGWAWINEANIFGGYDSSWNNADQKYQFIEIAAPAAADLDGWTVRFLDPKIGNAGLTSVITNNVAVFGQDLPSKKEGLKGMDPKSECVFHVLASSLSKSTLASLPGASVDGTWKIWNPNSAVDKYGEIGTSYPLSVQLVRPSGIIEHEIVALGTNDWATSVARNPDRHVEALNANESGGRFFYVGMDCEGGVKSLGVWHGHGGIEKTDAEPSSNYWNAVMGMTPGRINEKQTIDDKPPKPSGNSIVIYSIIEGDSLTQDFGEGRNTNGTVSAVLRMGDENGTNITYHAARWYELASVTTNDVPVAVPTATGRDYTVNVGRYASNDITVVASADVSRTLQEKYGLTPDNPYRTAILRWLAEGKTKYGAFKGPNKDSDTLGIGEFRQLDGTYKTNLTLKAMYWLDMDPTWNDGDLWLTADTVKIDASTIAPDVRLTVKMIITNTSDLAEAGLGPNKKYWAPYVLQGKDFDVSSWEYKDTMRWTNWTNATFKVTGMIFNDGLSSAETSRFSWLPLRYFVFVENSFAADFTSVIDIVDPFSTASPGYSAGWYDWVQKHGGVKPAIGFRWDIDDRLKPVSVDVLKETNPVY